MPSIVVARNAVGMSGIPGVPHDWEGEPQEWSCGVGGGGATCGDGGVGAGGATGAGAEPLLGGHWVAWMNTPLQTTPNPGLLPLPELGGAAGAGGGGGAAGVAPPVTGIRSVVTVQVTSVACPPAELFVNSTCHPVAFLPRIGAAAAWPEKWNRPSVGTSVPL